MSKKHHFLLRRLIACISILLMATSSVVYADDTVEQLEKKTNSLQQELNSYQQDIDTLSKKMEETIQKTEETGVRLSAIREELAEAMLEQDKQYQAMKGRIKYLYENDNSSLIALLFDSHSMAEFLNKAEFIETINEYDRGMLESLQEAVDLVQEKEADLQKEQDSLEELKKQLEEQEKDLAAKAGAASSELAKYQGQLDSAKAVIAAAKAELEKKAKEEAEKKARAEKEKASLAENESRGANPSQNVNSSPSIQNSGAYTGETTSDEMKLFASILECEAGSTDYNGILAVASCIMNRVKSPYYPNTIHGVVYQSGQFSPVWEGKLDRVLARDPSPLCVQAAQDALNGANNIGGCLSFRAAWTGHAGTVIGGNVFF